MPHVQRRIVSTVAVAATLALASCGFGGSTGGTGAEGETTINLMVPSYSDATRANWQTVIDGFQEANQGTTVNLEVVSWDDLDSVVTTRIQAGEAPDILNGGPFTGYVADDLLYPIADVLSPETLADFTPSFIDNASVGGTQYGAPMIASARALFINTDLADEAGVSGVPNTWAELKSASQAIADNGAVGYGMPLGSEESQAEAAIWFYGGGGGFGDETTITVDTPENLAAAEFMRGMIDDGETEADPGATNRSPLMDVFIQGEIGYQIGLPPTVGQIEEGNPDLNYEIAPIPTLDGEPFTLGVADHLMSFRNDDDKAESIRAFLDYFYSPEVYTTWVGAEGFLPTTQSGTEAMSGDEDLQPFLELLPDAAFYPSANPAWQATDAAFKESFGLIATDDPQTVLQTIQAAADAAN